MTIPVDLTNPGQFFACCGLLELADRFWEGAEGWYEPGHFCLSGVGVPPAVVDLCERIREASLEIVDCEGSVEIELRTPRPLRLNWWRKAVPCDADHLRTWSGRQ